MAGEWVKGRYLFKSVPKQKSEKSDFSLGTIQDFFYIFKIKVDCDGI